MESKQAAKAYYDFSTVFQRTKSFIDSHNEKHTNLKERLNANHRATAELITRLYAKQLNKAITLGDTLEELPGFKTYNPSLASCKGCTVRTIINHKERLKAAGFIIKEIHRGKSGIEIWINPAIFHTQQLSTTHNEISSDISQIICDFDQRVKNLHPLVHEQQEQKNNNSNVDKLITPEEGVRLSAHNPNITSVTGTLQEQDMNTRKSRNPAPDVQKRNGQLDAQGVGSAFLLQLVRDFWKYVQITLYPDILLSEPEETEILNLIWASVYRKFKIKGSKKDWIGYQEILYKRVDMVSRWLDRNPNRWVAPPHLYFHPENKRNGFDKTYQWFLKQEILKKEIRNQILIQKAATEWKAHKKGEGKYRYKTRLQLFRIQQQCLSQYHDQRLLDLYEKSVYKMVNL